MTPRSFHHLHFIQLEHKIFPVKSFSHFRIHLFSCLLKHKSVNIVKLFLNTLFDIFYINLLFNSIKSPYQPYFIFLEVLQSQLQPNWNPFHLPVVKFPSQRRTVIPIIQFNSKRPLFKYLINISGFLKQFFT